MFGASAGAATTAPAPAPWLQIRYNAAWANANPAETTLTKSSIRRVELLRSFTATRKSPCGSPTSPPVLEDPIFSESRVYSVQGDTLKADNIATGETIWATQFPGGGGSYVTPVVSHGLVVVTGFSCGPEPFFIAAYHSDTGTLAWQHSTVDGNLGTASVSGKYLVINSGGGGTTAAGLPYRGALAVYSVQTGALVWTDYRGETDAYNYCLSTNPIVVYGLTFTYNCTTKQLLARSLATGKLVWTRSGYQKAMLGDLDTSAAHHLFVSNEDTVSYEDVNPKNGVTRYTLPKFDIVLAVDGKRVYTSGYSRRVSAYDVSDGTLLWSRQIAGADAQGTVLTVANDVVYTYDGPVLNAATGARVATLPVGVRVVGDGRVGILPQSSATLQLYGLPGG